MERLRQRLTVAKQALASLNEVLRKTPPSLVERDAAIQRFEYTVEAVWRVAQRYLEVVEGLSAGSPKGTIRLSRDAGLLTEEQTIWALEMVDDRNPTVHTYNEHVAQQIYNHLPRYVSLIETWLNTMEARSNQRR